MLIIYRDDRGSATVDTVYSKLLPTRALSLSHACKIGRSPQPQPSGCLQ